MLFIYLKGLIQILNEKTFKEKMMTPEYAFIAFSCGTSLIMLLITVSSFGKDSIGTVLLGAVGFLTGIFLCWLLINATRKHRKAFGSIPEETLKVMEEDWNNGMEIIPDTKIGAHYLIVMRVGAFLIREMKRVDCKLSPIHRRTFMINLIDENNKTATTVYIKYGRLFKIKDQLFDQIKKANPDIEINSEVRINPIN